MDLELSVLDALYVTRDGGRNWQLVEPPAPKEVAPAHCEAHGLPTFEDAGHGFLQVNCTSGESPNQNLSLVLFATADGGRTWKPDRMVKNLDLNDLNSSRRYAQSALIGSEWLFATEMDHHPIVVRVGAGAMINAATEATITGPQYSEVWKMSFVNSTEGWVIGGGNVGASGPLLSTADGGAAWTDISPGPKPQVIQPHGTFVPAPRPSALNAVPPSTSPAAGSPTASTSKHLGFDTIPTPTQGIMQVWWNYSPYHDVGVYLNGARCRAARHPDSNLKSPVWVNAVTAMGWGLMPIWVGPQEPTNCRVIISSSTTIAGTEGKAQAKKASKSAETAGIRPGNIIYYDMEGYGCCDGPVVSFLSAWVAELHKIGFKAGVYVSGKYNGGNSSATVSLSGFTVAGINNNAVAIASNVIVLPDADTSDDAGEFTPSCPNMIAANGINDWGQIVGFANVNTSLQFSPTVQVGDLCVPATGN